MSGKLYDVTSIQNAINKELTTAQSVIALAEQEGRELTDTDRADIDARMAAIGEDGDQPTGLYADLARARKIEALNVAMATREKHAAPAAATVSALDADGWDNKQVAAQRITSLGYQGSKLKGFTGPHAERDAYFAGMWLKAMATGDGDAVQFCKDNGLRINAQQKESTDSLGGYLTPRVLSSAIWELQNEVGLAPRVCDVIPMTTDKVDVPKLTAGPSVYYTAEGASITESTATFGQINLSLVAKKMLVLISNELMQDSIIDVASRIAQRCAYELANQLDAEFVLGDGSGYGGQTGIIDAAAAGSKVTLSSGETSWSDVTLADLNTLVGTLPSAYHLNASFICSRAFKSQVIDKLLYAAGGNTVDSIAGPSSAPGAAGFLFGRPIYTTDHMPADAADKAAIGFGDWAKCVALGVRSGVDIAMSSEYAFDKSCTTIRAEQRTNIQVHEPGTASACGGYALLMTAAS